MKETRNKMIEGGRYFMEEIPKDKNQIPKKFQTVKKQAPNGGIADVRGSGLGGRFFDNC
jgi:hypothetical protein